MVDTNVSIVQSSITVCFVILRLRAFSNSNTRPLLVTL